MVAVELVVRFHHQASRPTQTIAIHCLRPAIGHGMLPHPSGVLVRQIADHAVVVLSLAARQADSDQCQSLSGAGQRTLAGLFVFVVLIPTGSGAAGRLRSVSTMLVDRTADTGWAFPVRCPGAPS